MKFEKKADRIYVAFVAVATANLSGAISTKEVAIRIDGREGAYRVDMLTMASMPFVAVDGGTGFRTLANAKRHASHYVRAIREQATLTPRYEYSHSN